MNKIPKIKHCYGWKPDLPDQRDKMFAAAVIPITQLPAKINLLPHCPPVYDQGELGSCTANAIAAAIQFERLKQNVEPEFVPSRLFIYYNERVMEHTVNSDAGAQIRDGIKSVVSQGDCPETEWPYDIEKFTHKPSAKCYRDAIKYKTLAYQRVPQILQQMKACLASGYPFVFGFSVYSAFDSDAAAKTGIINLPDSSESLLGGHAVLAIGYDDNSQRFTVRNSWGDWWGAKGYFTMPYAYLTDPKLANDFWTIRLEAA